MLNFHDDFQLSENALELVTNDNVYIPSKQLKLNRDCLSEI